MKSMHSKIIPITKKTEIVKKNILFSHKKQQISKKLKITKIPNIKMSSYTHKIHILLENGGLKI